VLVVHAGKLAARLHAVLPQQLAIRAAERLDDEEGFAVSTGRSQRTFA